MPAPTSSSPTPSAANRRRLALHNLQDATRELNRLAAENARAVADAAGRPVVVAGSVGPTGDLLAPLGPLTEDEAVEVFVEQIEGLKEGGADVIWIETMSALEEIRAAARAAAKVGMPFTLTASFDTAGKTMMGIAPAALVEFAATLDDRPLAVGGNCGVGASDLLVSVLAMTAARPDAIVIAKANCGVPTVHGDHADYSGTPELMADYARLAIDAGARIIGGCCGTSPAHLAAMRAGARHARQGGAADASRRSSRAIGDAGGAAGRRASARKRLARRAPRPRGAARGPPAGARQLDPLHHAAAAAGRGALRGRPRDHRAQCRDDPRGDRHRLQGATRARSRCSRRPAATSTAGACAFRAAWPASSSRPRRANSPSTRATRRASVPIGGKATVFAPVYGSPFVHDLDRGRRYGTIEDFANFVKLAYQSPYIHHSGGTVCEPVDLPVNKRHLEMVYAHMRWSDKPYMGSVTHPERAKDTVRDVGDPLRRGVRPRQHRRDEPDQRQLAAGLGRLHARRGRGLCAKRTRR